MEFSGAHAAVFGGGFYGDDAVFCHWGKYSGSGGWGEKSGAGGGRIQSFYSPLLEVNDGVEFGDQIYHGVCCSLYHLLPCHLQHNVHFETHGYTPAYFPSFVLCPFLGECLLPYNSSDHF